MSTSAPEIEPLGASTLNRDWRLEVDTGTSAEPVWTIVRGRMDFKPNLDHTLQEDSDMDSEGYKSQTATAIEWGLEVTVARKVTAGSAPTYDPGQEALRLAADEMGPANTVHVRWCKLGAVRVEAYEGYAAVSYAPEGGGMDELDKAAITLTGQGKRFAIAHPYPG